MEGSAYTERTLGLFRDRLFPAFGTSVGVVLQSRISRRTEQDLTALLSLGARVRLWQGAPIRSPRRWLSPGSATSTWANYVRCMERLLREGTEPAIATHDEAIIAHARTFARRTARASGQSAMNSRCCTASSRISSAHSAGIGHSCASTCRCLERLVSLPGVRRLAERLADPCSVRMWRTVAREGRSAGRLGRERAWERASTRPSSRGGRG